MKSFNTVERATINQTICFDFDGVIHSYTSGWQGVDNIPDPPTEGCKETINLLKKKGHRIVVHSTRCQTQEGREAIGNYLLTHDIEVDEICTHKPAAIIYIDDRAIQFNGNWNETMESISNFDHWLGFDDV